MATLLKIEDMLAQAKQEFIDDILANLDRYETAEDRLAAVKAVVAEQYDRDSDKLAALLPLGGDSMIGSYFRAPDPQDTEAEAAWLEGASCKVVEGMVIKQPFTSNETAIYLVEFYSERGGTGYQQLVDLDRMLAQRWAFYDSEAWLSRQSDTGAVAESYAAAMAQEQEGGEA